MLYRELISVASELLCSTALFARVPFLTFKKQMIHFHKSRTQINNQAKLKKHYFLVYY